MGMVLIQDIEHKRLRTIKKRLEKKYPSRKVDFSLIIKNALDSFEREGLKIGG